MRYKTIILVDHLVHDKIVSSVTGKILAEEFWHTIDLHYYCRKDEAIARFITDESPRLKVYKILNIEEVIIKSWWRKLLDKLKKKNK